MTLSRIPGLGWNYTINNHSWASGFDIFCWWFTQFLGSFLGWPAKAGEVDIGGGVLLSKGVNLHLLFSLLFHHLELSHPVIQVAWNTGKTSHLLWKKKKKENKKWRIKFVDHFLSFIKAHNTVRQNKEGQWSELRRKRAWFCLLPRKKYHSRIKKEKIDESQIIVKIKNFLQNISI